MGDSATKSESAKNSLSEREQLIADIDKFVAEISDEELRRKLLKVQASIKTYREAIDKIDMNSSEKFLSMIVRSIKDDLGYISELRYNHGKAGGKEFKYEAYLKNNISNLLTNIAIFFKNVLRNISKHYQNSVVVKQRDLLKKVSDVLWDDNEEIKIVSSTKEHRNSVKNYLNNRILYYEYDIASFSNLEFENKNIKDFVELAKTLKSKTKKMLETDSVDEFKRLRSEAYTDSVLNSYNSALQQAHKTRKEEFRQLALRNIEIYKHNINCFSKYPRFEKCANAIRVSKGMLKNSEVFLNTNFESEEQYLEIKDKALSLKTINSYKALIEEAIPEFEAVSAALNSISEISKKHSEILRSLKNYSLKLNNYLETDIIVSPKTLENVNASIDSYKQEVEKILGLAASALTATSADELNTIKLQLDELVKGYATVSANYEKCREGIEKIVEPRRAEYKKRFRSIPSNLATEERLDKEIQSLFDDPDGYAKRRAESKSKIHESEVSIFETESDKAAYAILDKIKAKQRPKV